MENFNIGDKVVCIDDTPGWSGARLKKGNIYVVLGYNPELPDEIFINDVTERSWKESRFRKLTDEENDQEALVEEAKAIIEQGVIRELEPA